MWQDMHIHKYPPCLLIHDNLQVYIFPLSRQSIIVPSYCISSNLLFMYNASKYSCKVPHYTVFQKKTSTHIIGYKLRNSSLILIIFDIKIPHII